MRRNLKGLCLSLMYLIEGLILRKHPCLDVSVGLQDGGSLDQVLKEARRIPEDILGKVSIAVRSPVASGMITDHTMQPFINSSFIIVTNY